MAVLAMCENPIIVDSSGETNSMEKSWYLQMPFSRPSFGEVMTFVSLFYFCVIDHLHILPFLFAPTEILCLYFESIISIIRYNNVKVVISFKYENTKFSPGCSSVWFLFNLFFPT